MKHRIHISLFSLYIGSLAIHAADIPDDYDKIEINTTNDINNYNNNTANDYYAFIISSDLIFKPTTNPSWTASKALFNGGELLFTSPPQTDPYALSFSDGKTNAFNNPTHLNFDTLSSLTFSNNVKGNGVAECYGGAVYMGDSGKLSICNVNNQADNEDVIFSSNSVSTATRNTSSYARGGAIYSKARITINNNADVIFKDNTAKSSRSSNVEYMNSYATATGGAIHSSGNIYINNNEDVSFIGNQTKGEDGNAWAGSRSSALGGAIYSTAKIQLNNNNSVLFTANNSTVAKGSSYYNNIGGGAIYASNSISITGNNTVLFEKNYEHRNTTYRLRSIYMAANSSDARLVLSAKTGGIIAFYDSVYMSNYTDASISLNADYEDSVGVIQKACGDIIFSGRYTEEHLKEIKIGTAGTATEITNSRTSELLNTVNLYGGILRVEDKAILKTHDINVVAGSNATMKLTNATVNADSYNVTVGGSGRLEISSTDGSSTLTAKNIYIEKDGTLSAVNKVNPDEVITLAAAETVSIYNEKLGGIINGNVDLAAGSTYQADGAHLSVKNGTLTFNATSDEKINLVLTLQAQYETDSQVLLFTDVKTVEFILDNASANIIGESIMLNAADYFCGDWINENTELIYDGSSVYVTGVNRVIPEPATATLSLLALAALVARRRRRG